MRFYLAVLAVLLFGCDHSPRDCVGVQEIASLFEDKQNISSKDKNVLLFFSSNKCQYCDKLNAEIKNSPTLSGLIADELESFYINLSEERLYTFGDTQFTSKELASFYQVTSTPTLVFLNPKGGTMLKYVGFLDATRLIATIEFLTQKATQEMSEDEIAKNLLILYHKKKI